MSRKLFVGNLPYSVTSERLQEAFSQFGTVSSSKVIVDRETGRSRGFAFLEMETDDQGAAAMQAMNGALLDGRSIAVREAVTYFVIGTVAGSDSARRDLQNRSRIRRSAA